MSGYNADWRNPRDPQTGKFIDFYAILGISRTATTKEIESAYRKLSLKCHPDKNKSQAAKELFIKLGKAKEVLCDEEEREWYDYALSEEALGFPERSEEKQQQQRGSGSERRSSSRIDRRRRRRHRGENEAEAGFSGFWGTTSGESGGHQQNPFGGMFDEMKRGFDPFSFMGFDSHGFRSGSGFGHGHGHDDRQSRDTHRSGPSSFFESTTSRHGGRHDDPFSLSGFAQHGHDTSRDHHRHHHHHHRGHDSPSEHHQHQHHHGHETPRDDHNHHHHGHDTPHDHHRHRHHHHHHDDPFSSPFFQSTSHAHHGHRDTNTRNPPTPSSESTSHRHHDRPRRRRDTQQSHDTPHDPFSFPGFPSHGHDDPFPSFFESSSGGLGGMPRMPQMPHMPSPFSESTSHGGHCHTRRDRGDSHTPHDPFSFFESSHGHGSFPFPEFPSHGGHGTQRRRDSSRRRHH